MHKGPQTKQADALHARKYRGRYEDFSEAANRWSFALKDDDRHYHRLREIFLPMRFMPAGRVQSAMGATRETTPYNCYVSGTLADSYTDGEGSIMQRAHEAAATMRMGGGIGYDFSTLRPSGFKIMKLDSHSTGPVSFMQIFNAVCLATSSTDHRRGAQMGVLRIDHPDIEEFIHAKQNTTELKGFNISVAVTDKFMECVHTGKPFKLEWGGISHREIDAAQLWEKIMRSTWDWADPGVLFIDRVNKMNNLWYCEKIAATNPCGEQPLPPYGACLLGSFNLPKYLVKDNGGSWGFNFDQLEADIPFIVRAMDNVVDRALYPLPAQKVEAISKRRMGLGITGLANAGEACGYEYGSPAFLEFEARVLETINIGCYRASIEIAKVKGSFPYFDRDKYLRGEYIQTLPEDVRDGIQRHGIRNSHLTSIAPTGTISMCADNVSSGLEPVFAHRTRRPINTADGIVEEVLEDYGVAFLGTAGRLAADVTAKESIAVLTTAQRYVDSAVSKTINMDGRVMPWDDFKDIYKMAWEGGAKGCTTFNISGKRAALLTSDGEGTNCAIDPVTGQRDCN